jgi:hypothetical protein
VLTKADVPLCSEQVKIAFRDRWGLAVYRVKYLLLVIIALCFCLPATQARRTCGNRFLRLSDSVLSITVTTMIARRVNASSGRARALVAGSLASAAISIICDFTLAYFAQGYDRSLEAVTSRSVVGFVIAFFVTLKSRTAA